MKVIEHGNIEKLKRDFPRERRCEKCRCLFEFDIDDIILDDDLGGINVARSEHRKWKYPFVKCPECEHISSNGASDYTNYGLDEV